METVVLPVLETTIVLTEDWPRLTSPKSSAPGEITRELVPVITTPDPHPIRIEVGHRVKIANNIASNEQGNRRLNLKLEIQDNNEKRSKKERLYARIADLTSSN